MADTEVSIKDIPLLESKDDYVDVFRFVHAFNYIYKNAEKLQVVTMEDVKDENGNPVKDENGKVKQIKHTTLPRVMNAIIDNWDSIKLNSGDGLLYPNKPTIEELEKAMANAKTLSGHQDVLSATRSLYSDPQVIKSCYADFAHKQSSAVDNLQENLGQSAMNLAESKKQNRKAKSKRFWSILGMGATALLTGGVAVGYVVGALGLAGGLAGLASISTMPFAMLSVAGGFLLYKAGGFVVKKIWKKLQGALKNANNIIKGDEKTLGSKKNLKLNKSLQAQNKNALGHAMAQNAYSQSNNSIIDMFEGKQNEAEQQEYKDEVLDFGPAKARTPLEAKAESDEVVYEDKDEKPSPEKDVKNEKDAKDEEDVYEVANEFDSDKKPNEVANEFDSNKKQPDAKVAFGQDQVAVDQMEMMDEHYKANKEVFPYSDDEPLIKHDAIDNELVEEEYDPYQQTILGGEYLKETEPRAEEKLEEQSDDTKKPKIESFAEIMARAQNMKDSELYNTVKTRFDNEIRHARILDNAQNGKISDEVTDEELKELKSGWNKTGRALRNHVPQEEKRFQELNKKSVDEMSEEERSEFADMVRTRLNKKSKVDDDTILKALRADNNITDAELEEFKKTHPRESLFDYSDESLNDMGMDE